MLGNGCKKKKKHSRPQMRALLNTYPKKIRHGFFNAKQSFSMQKGPLKPNVMATQSLKHISMHNAHFKAQQDNSSRHERDDECNHASMD